MQDLDIVIQAEGAESMESLRAVVTDDSCTARIFVYDLTDPRHRPAMLLLSTIELNM